MDKNIKALVMSIGDPSSDPRPRRAIELCHKLGYNVTVVCSSVNGALPYNEICLIPKAKYNIIVKCIRKPFYILLSLFIKISGSTSAIDYYNNLRFTVNCLARTAGLMKYDLIIVEDLNLLPIAFKFKKDARIIFDAREYYPRENDESRLFRFWEKPQRIQICRKYLQKCDALITVSNGLKAEYEKEFGINMQVIRSMPSFADLYPNETNSDHIKIVHHGIANENRKIETMLAIFNKLSNRFSFDLYLTGPLAYINELKQNIENQPRIRILDPIPYKSIIQTLNSYDVGFFYVEPVTFNLKHCLPNKLFEYIQARLAVAISPSPDMAELVRSYKIGVIAESFEPFSMAQKIESLTKKDITNYKRNCHQAARELCFEIESKKMQEMITNLMVN